MNNKGVSAVIGVILMVAITVSIASTVYFYVSGIIEPNDYQERRYSIEGQLENITLLNNKDKFRVVINNMSYDLFIPHIFDFEIGKSYRLEISDNTVLYIWKLTFLN